MRKNDLLYVCSYTDFGNLAHTPRGTVADDGMTCFHVEDDGNLTLVETIKNVENPAFLRFDPQTEVLYACTESINDNGLIIGYKFKNTKESKIEPFTMQTAHGTSTCYLTLDAVGRKLLFVNYWDSSIGSLPLAIDGSLHPVKEFVKPNKVSSKDRADHLRNRQLEPHAHALVLDPYQSGEVAFVPDLGLDVIRQYKYDSTEGSFKVLGSIPSCTGKGPHGPRYIEFHPDPEAKFAYVVNELSSRVSVFKYESNGVKESKENAKFNSLTLIQTISTIPSDFKGQNTCGRIHVEKSGNFVLVSNRGHDSIAVYNINRENGKLSLVGITSTLGQTPRHFQLNTSGTLLIAANQDSDTLVPFLFNKKSGELKHTGFVHICPSPNFVQFVPRYTSTM